MRMIVTTAGKGADQLREKAARFSQKLNGQLIERKKHSIQELIDHYKEDVLVVGKRKADIILKAGR